MGQVLHTNVVMVPKPNMENVCMEYTDLNKAHPKKNFPLPKLDWMVDSTVEHAFLSFMDAYSGFHQIRMCPYDQDKTSFITQKGLYVCMRMPFGLMNALATIQRLLNTVFQP